MLGTLLFLLAVQTPLPAEEVRPDRPRSAYEEIEEAPRDRLPVEALCGRGEHYLEDGDKDALLEAQRIFEVAVKYFSGEACAHEGLSRTLLALFLRHIDPRDEHLDRALDAAREAVRLDPVSSGARAALAMALLANSKPVQAGEAAREATKLDPEDVKALRAETVALMAMRQLEAASGPIEKALELRPDLPGLYLTLGNLRLLTHEYDRALLAYQTAQALAPGMISAAFQRAAAYERIGSHDAAAVIFEKLLAENPEERPLIHLYMGQSLMKRSSWRAALSVLGRADFENRRGLSKGSALFLEARCHEELGQVDEARAKYRAVIEQWPQATGGLVNPERLMFGAAEKLSRLSQEAGDLDEAVEVLEAASKQPDATFDILIRLALLYEEYQLAPQALELLEQTASRPLNPRDADDHVQAYVTWARLARSAKDEVSLARMGESLETHVPALERLDNHAIDIEVMRAFSIAGMGQQALSCLRSAVERGYSHLAWMKSDPDLENLCRATGFSELAKSVKPPGAHK